MCTSTTPIKIQVTGFDVARLEMGTAFASMYVLEQRITSREASGLMLCRHPPDSVIHASTKMPTIGPGPTQIELLYSAGQVIRKHVKA